MRVLYFSPRICWPTISGAHLRDFYFARTLARNAQLTYVGLVNEDAQAQAEQLRQRLEPQNGTKVYALRRDAGYRPINILRGLIGPTPLNVLNYTSQKVIAALDPILSEQSFDVIQIESMHLIAYAQHIRQVAPRTRLILDWHNIESEILARYAENDSNPLRAFYAKRTSVLSRGMSKISYWICATLTRYAASASAKCCCSARRGRESKLSVTASTANSSPTGRRRQAKSAMCSSWAAWTTTPTSTQPCTLSGPPGH